MLMRYVPLRLMVIPTIEVSLTSGRDYDRTVLSRQADFSVILPLCCAKFAVGRALTSPPQG